MVIKINDIDVRILSLFTNGYEEDFYIREVERLLNISSRTALMTLDKLEQHGILESKIRGKIKIYSIRKSAFSKEFFILAEQYKKIQFLEKNMLIKEVLEKSDNFMQGIVIIFGSYAKGTQKDTSDLDIFIVGTYDEVKIKEISKKYGVDINIKSYPRNMFNKKFHEDILLREIAGNHILIKDVEGFVKRVATWNR